MQTRFQLPQGCHCWQFLAILGAPCTSYVRYQHTLYAVHVPPFMAAAPAMSLQTFSPTGGTQGLKSVLPHSMLFYCTARNQLDTVSCC
jgi:hypothetical protein